MGRCEPDQRHCSYSDPYRQGAGIRLSGSWKAGAVGACHFESRPGAVLAHLLSFVRQVSLVGAIRSVGSFDEIRTAVC